MDKGDRPKNQISHRKQLSSLEVKENIALVKLCKCQERLKKQPLINLLVYH